MKSGKIIQSEEKTILRRVVGNFIRTGNASDEQVKVTNLPKGKTSYVEQIGVDDAVIYAGYSSRSGTVYLSLC